MRIIYLGTPDFAVAGLKTLIENNYNVVAVVTAPDKPAGRGKKIQETAVKKYALSQNIDVLQPTNLKDEAFLSKLKSYKADLQIVVAFRMLPEKVWNMPPLGTFNLHASLLPQYRGAAPINRAIMNGEIETGVTTFFLKHEIDTGNIILREKINIHETMDAGELHDCLMEIGADLILKTVQLIENDKVEETPQDSIAETELKSAPKIFKQDCKIDWSFDAKTIYNHIRGLSPYPAAWTKLNGKSLKIFKGETLIEKHNLNVGDIKTDNKTYLQIAVKDGFYKVSELQIEGKKRMAVADFLRGYSNTLNQIG